MVTAEVVAFQSFNELNAALLVNADAVRGKIVLMSSRFVNYSSNVPYRGSSARLEPHGALAVIIRSVTPLSLYTCHTGSMSDAKVPAACCTTEDAELMCNLLKAGKKLTASFYSSAHLNPPAISRNTIIELPGRELTEEMVVIGAHIGELHAEGCAARESA